MFRAAPRLKVPAVPTDHRAALERAATQLLSSLAALPRPAAGLRVVDAAGGLACLIQVWDARRPLPTAAGERRRRAEGGRKQCKADVLEAVGTAGVPLTRKEVIRAMRAAGKDHGAGTVAKALADLTAAGELVNPKDRRGYRLPGWPARRDDTPSLFD